MCLVCFCTGFALQDTPTSSRHEVLWLQKFGSRCTMPTALLLACEPGAGKFAKICIKKPAGILICS